MIQDIISSVLMIIGALFMLIAAIGLVRMPDLFLRMSASTKAATLGAGCILIATAVHFGELEILIRMLLIIGFIFLTAPVSAHMIGRAGYLIGVELWEGTQVDELHGLYDLQTRKLATQEVNEVVTEP